MSAPTPVPSSGLRLLHLPRTNKSQELLFLGFDVFIDSIGKGSWELLFPAAFLGSMIFAYFRLRTTIAEKEPVWTMEERANAFTPLALTALLSFLGNTIITGLGFTLVQSVRIIVVSGTFISSFASMFLYIIAMRFHREKIGSIEGASETLVPTTFTEYHRFPGMETTGTTRAGHTTERNRIEIQLFFIKFILVFLGLSALFALICLIIALV